MTLRAEKRQLRSEMRRRRAIAAAENPNAAEAVALNFPMTARWTSVAGTLPVRDELDPRPLMKRLEALGAKLALPRVVSAGQPLAFHQWNETTRFLVSTFGISEPAPETPELTPDLVLVPLLAFDRSGRRLGYGGGFYDRTLAALRSRGPTFAVGIGYSAQEVAHVPADENDQRLDAILTERACFPVIRSC